MDALVKLLHLITFGPYRAKREAARRRANYEFLKAAISERHFAGYAGLVVDFKGKRFDWTDLQSFKPPMYAIARQSTKDNKPGNFCIFWDRGKLTQEIGAGAPLQPGEVLSDDEAANQRVWKKADPANIDEQKPLVTHQKEKAACPAAPRTSTGGSSKAAKRAKRSKRSGTRG